MIHKKVVFQGETYWLHEVDMGYNVSPLSHYDEVGNLLADPFHDISFAVIWAGTNEILRHGKVIGKIEDLKGINE